MDDARKPAGDVWEVEKLLARGVGTKGKRYLVRWKGFTEKHDTWEPLENLERAAETVAAFDRERDAAQAREDAAAQKAHAEKVKQRKAKQQATSS